MGPAFSIFRDIRGSRPCAVQPPPGALALKLHHAAVEAALLHQLRRGALLGHMAVLQHHDMVGSRHGTHPVGDHQHRLALKQTGKGALHLCLVFHIQGGCGLVQQDDGGILQQGPGNGDPLPLPAGKFNC